MDSHGTDRPASEAPFSELIRRWWDEGDRLSEGLARAEAEAGRRKRTHELGANLRQWTSRHRMVVMAGAGLLSALGVVTLRFIARAELAATAAAPVEVAAAPVVAAPRPTARPLAMPPVVVVAAAPASALPPPSPSPAAAPAPSATVAVAPSAEPASDPEPAFQRQPVPVPEAAATTEVVPPSKPEPVAKKPAPPSGPVPIAKKPEPPSEPVPVALSAPVAQRAARPAAPSTVAPSTEVGGHGSLLEACKRALDKERARDALAACGRFAAAAPGSVEAIVSLARAELLAGREAETLRLARRASAIDPRCAEAYLLIGTAAQLTGRKPDARTAYQAYLHLAPRGLHAAEVRAILRTL